MDRSQFQDSKDRIARAITHVGSIRATWEQLIDRKGDCVISIERRGQHEFVAKASIKHQPENDISLLLGEYFYQLRAALDATAYRSLVLQEGIDPPLKADSVEFPVYADERKFNRSPFVNCSLPQEMKDWLRSIQPFAFADSPDEEIRELGRRLKLLHDCARKDRHRRLHVTMASITNMETAFEHTPNLAISHLEPIPINFLAGDTDFLRFDVHFFGPGHRMLRLAAGVTIELAIEDIQGLAGNALIRELEKIMLAARHIVDVFENGHRA